MTRITSNMIADTALFNIEQNQSRIEQLQSQLTSGSRIRVASDDPIGSARAMSFQEGLDQTSQYIANVDQATGWLNTTDKALSEMTNLLQRARELAVQGSSDTASAQDRAAINTEVQQLQQHALNMAQTKFGASYLFSGTRSDQPGYVTANPSTVPGAYQGNTNQIMREVSPGVTVAVNVPTDPSSGGTPVFDQVFTALNQLQTGTNPASQSGANIRASIGTIDAALNSILTTRALVGAKTNRMELLGQQLNDQKVSMTSLLSKVKDVDMAEAMTNFSMAQSVYQASLKAGAQAIQPSLLDYLR